MAIIILIIIAIVIAVKISSTQSQEDYPTQEQHNQEHISNLEEYRECNPMTAENKLKIVQDCINLVNNTKNPDVFFSRYDMLIEELSALSRMEGRIKFLGQSPSVALQDFLSRKQYTFSDFINRYYKNVEEKINNLTTEKAKQNNAKKFYDSLVVYRDVIPSTCFDLIEKRYNQLQSLYSTKSSTEIKTSSHSSALSINDNPTESTMSPSPISNNRDINEWNIIVSFNKSTSANFDKALHWARKSTDYQENEYNGKIIYQAMYSSNPQSFMDFMQLYELVKDWKSTAFIINGELVDKKIVGKIKWCYGDKCITAKNDFCYGASYMTKNPFSCHRLQISACNNPWWSFGQQQGNKIKIDKDAIVQRINEYSSAYQYCPAFNYNRAIDVVTKIPDYITLEEREQMQFQAYNSNVNAFLGIK